MIINPIAIGMLVVPLLKEFRIVGNVGMKYPIPTPIAMATKIHKVRFLSRKFSVFDAIFTILFEKIHIIIPLRFEGFVRDIFQLVVECCQML